MKLHATLMAYVMHKSQLVPRCLAVGVEPTTAGADASRTRST